MAQYGWKGTAGVEWKAMFQGVAETQKGTHKDEHSLFPYKNYLYKKINGPVFGLEKELYLTYFTRFFKNKNHLLYKYQINFV